jgi:hypothetical protein
MLMNSGSVMLILYKGWKIYAHPRKISKTEKPAIIYKLKTLFNSEGFSSSENDNTINICYGPNQIKINVYFQETKYSSERNGNSVTYYIVFESPFFGLRAYDERVHQDLCEKTIQKITWRKQGVLVEDNTEVPIFKSRKTRIK